MRHPIRLMLVVCCFALVGFGALASAANKSFQTKTTLHGTPKGIAGQISSPNEVCLKHRILKVGYAGPARYGPALIHAKSDGSWAWNDPGAPPSHGVIAIASVYELALKNGQTCRSGSKTKHY
jgi:hypothetical protein